MRLSWVPALLICRGFLEPCAKRDRDCAQSGGESFKMPLCIRERARGCILVRWVPSLPFLKDPSSCSFCRLRTSVGVLASARERTATG